MTDTLADYIDALKQAVRGNKIVAHAIKFERDLRPVLGGHGYSRMKPTGTRYIHLIIELRDEVEVAAFHKERFRK